MNASLAALYHRVILEHASDLRARGALAGATHEARADNPLCGDRLTMRLRVDRGGVAAARFEGDGCALSLAAASLLAHALPGRTLEGARGLAGELTILVGGGERGADRALLGDLVVLEGAREFPARRRCVLLAVEAVLAAIAGGRVP